MTAEKFFSDGKFWFQEFIYFAGEILYTLGEWLASVCYLLLMICNMLGNNLHADSVDDERQRLHEEQKRQRYLEEDEKEQLYFEERQRLYALRFGNWQERRLAAITSEECAEAETARDKRGARLEIQYHDGRTAVATARRIEQLKVESSRRRDQISRLYCEVDYLRHQERISQDSERRNIFYRVRALEEDIASLERQDKQSQMDLQNVSFY